MTTMQIVSALALALSVGFALCTVTLKPDWIDSYPKAINSAEAAAPVAAGLRP